ncbi:hypothetical protein K3722_04685 [Leisingera caerulea]|uniref:Uncharacterized protein n=1 Tax=Leisingera caerulea TaxID=506591 RepID=A0ABY5WZH0_LEICA|nr:hypothetical protein [Leisingera caerulea]UWQ59425.1 hypothetical protein K3722_04685 [Leisingera caerulea]
MRYIIFFIVFWIAGCSSSFDDQFRVQGAGLQLHTAQTDRNTENLKKYFGALCLQAGYSYENCAPAPGAAASGNWHLLVQTGYNDIDYRCDAYLTWIDSKRSERLLFEGTTNALGTLAAGLLKGTSASADKLADIALALGFARDIYNSYQSSILLGLEGSTIKEIVNKRRTAHREEFRNVRYASRPDAIFALRKYLTICTPQSILTDVNTFSRGAAGGDLPPIREDAAASARVVGLAPTAPATPPRRDTTVVPRQPDLFEGPGFSINDVRTFQAAACIDVDGQVGNSTLSSVRLLEQWKNFMDSSGKISSQEWAILEPELLERPCNRQKYANIYENLAHGSDGGVQAVRAMVAKGALDSSLSGQPLNAANVRTALRQLRSEIGPSEQFPGLGDMAGELTSPLYTRALGRE